MPNRKKTPVRITPPLPENLIELDLELCKLLISEVFDPEKDIQSIIADDIDRFGGVFVPKPNKPIIFIGIENLLLIDAFINTCSFTRCSYQTKHFFG